MMSETRIQIRTDKKELVPFLDRKVEQYNQNHAKKITRNQLIERYLMRMMENDYDIYDGRIEKIESRLSLLNEKVNELIMIEKEKIETEKMILDLMLDEEGLDE